MLHKIKQLFIMKRKGALLIIGGIVVLIAVGISLMLIIDNQSLSYAIKNINQNNYQISISIISNKIGGEQHQSALNSSEPNVTTSEPMVISVLQQDGDICHEKGTSGEYYFYKQGKQDYVRFLDTFYGMEKGKWVDVKAESFSMKRSFDPSIISKDNFTYSNGTWIPKSDRLTNTTFTSIMNSSDTEIKKYSNITIKLRLASNRFNEIILNYTYNGQYNCVQTFTFSNYGKISLVLPKVGASG